MKKSSLSFLAIMAVLTLFSCKKEVPPELVVSVVNDENEPIGGVWVATSVDRANLGVIEPTVLDSQKTNNFGRAFFEFENTIIVDVSLYRGRVGVQKVDSTTVFLETKRSRDKDSNVIERKLVFR